MYERQIGPTKFSAFCEWSRVAGNCRGSGRFKQRFKKTASHIWVPQPGCLLGCQAEGWRVSLVKERWEYCDGTVGGQPPAPMVYSYVFRTIIDSAAQYWGVDREELNLNNYWVPLS